jgi:hypothetical protein
VALPIEPEAVGVWGAGQVEDVLLYDVNDVCA